MKEISPRHKRPQKTKATVRLNFEFPVSEYPYLKMVCASKGISMKAFATETLIKAIEDAEDELLVKRARVRLENLKKEDIVSWTEAMDHLGRLDEDNL